MVSRFYYQSKFMVVTAVLFTAIIEMKHHLYLAETHHRLTPEYAQFIAESDHEDFIILAPFHQCLTP